MLESVENPENVGVPVAAEVAEVDGLAKEKLGAVLGVPSAWFAGIPKPPKADVVT